MESDGSQYGSLGRQFFLHLIWLPQLIAEWAALIPLILHLAAPTYDHKLAGRVCLKGQVDVGVFPRLGTAASIANLLEQVSDFLDRTATDSRSSLIVWDIMWGSRFPCVNGAASTILASEASRVRRRMERNADPARRDGQRKETRNPHRDSAFCRPQVLNIYSCSQATHRPTCLQDVKLWHRALQAAGITVVVGGIIVLCLFGLFGTAAAVVVGILSKAACQYVHLDRTSGFLVSNEPSSANRGGVTGAMLVSAHCNATTWNLYVGDRGVVDALLNKPMVHLRPCVSALWYWFKIADVLQLLAMTFAAAQKGWDGVAMVVLMFLDWTFEVVTDRDSLVAQRFLKNYGVEIKSSQLSFKGISAMNRVYCMR
jgi:hypothetical protein